MQLTGGRSVYSEEQLERWKATLARPVKVINYLLVSYIEPAVPLHELRALDVINVPCLPILDHLKPEFPAFVTAAGW